MANSMFPTPLPTRCHGPRRVDVGTKRPANAHESADIHALDEMAAWLEDMADDMGRWCPGAGLIHRVNNTRMLLLSQAFRLR